ncbi:ABC transporter permease, partial [Jutongia sp.]|uniref:ABC transporter permease n=1 Tax=Jutongia sp. TaxID=2944204 RepID=UPI00307AB44D
MKNPLNKRLLRELRTEFGKYAVIFLFMVMTIGLESGDLVASDSMIATCNQRYEKYHVENGHFHLKQKMKDEAVNKIEKEDVTVYQDFYVERSYKGKDKKEKTLRIYESRDEINQLCIMDGSLPEKDNEIVIDRMFADNNKTKTGDILSIDGKDYTVSGLVSFSDYTTMFQNNSDMMFDSVNFGVAMGTKSEFESLSDRNLTYNYAWTYNAGDPADDMEEKKWSDDLLETIVDAAGEGGGATALGSMLGVLNMDNGIDDYVPRYTNQAMNFAGDDLGSDRGSMLAFLYILIAVLAFIFGVTISHTITKEATVIGTLRASGYTRGELFRHYISMPIIVTLLAALVGNILGYTYMKGVIADLYYSSYSLPKYETLWNQQAFVLTTLVPILLMLLVTGVTLIRKLKLSPLQFIRRDLTKSKRKKAVKLPHFKFFNRFRLRIIMQNISSYLTLIFGVFVASTILLFGMMFVPLLNNVSNISREHMAAKYQYMLKGDARTSNRDAEKFAVCTMNTYVDGYNQEAATVYGIFDNSRYIKDKLPEKGAVISSGMAEKYKLKEGDDFLLKEQYEDKLIKLQVRGILDSPTTIGVYMSHSYYEDVFDVDKDYYSAYFSNSKITDISDNKIINCITEKDMTKMAEQLKVSMGDMFTIVEAFAVVMFILVVYLLTKIILERN